MNTMYIDHRCSNNYYAICNIKIIYVWDIISTYSYRKTYIINNYYYLHPDMYQV